MAGKKSGPPQFGLQPCEGRKQIYNRKKVFEKLDTDGDGYVAAHEYVGSQKMFEELDADGDGKLSFEEAQWMMTFSDIPSGHFLMGSDSGKEDNRPVHEVHLDSFKMSTTEVTNAQYCLYLNAAIAKGEINVELSDAGGKMTRIYIPVPAYEVFGASGTEYAGKPYIKLSPVTGLSHIKLKEHPILIPEHPLNRCWITYVPDLTRFYVNPGFEDWPVSCMNWYGAFAFAEHYGLSLPTEAEWEYAASGGKQFEYATNDGTVGCQNANYACFARGPRAKEHKGADTPDEWIGYLTRVGSYPPNPFGLFDLAGNVWEYCLDWYKEDFYRYCVDNGINRNPVNLVGEEPPMDGSAKGAPWETYTHDARVRRGGSYQYHESTLLTANRERMYPFEGNDHFGFRVVVRSPSVVFNGKE